MHNFRVLVCLIDYTPWQCLSGCWLSTLGIGARASLFFMPANCRVFFLWILVLLDYETFIEYVITKKQMALLNFCFLYFFSYVFHILIFI